MNTAKNCFHFSGKMSINTYERHKCSTAFHNIRRISSTRQFLSVEITKSLFITFDLPNLHQCIIMFYGCPIYMICRH